MKNCLRELEVKMVVAKSMVLAPFKNRKAVDEPTNSGLKGSAGLFGTLILIGLLVGIIVIIVGNGNDLLTDARNMFIRLGAEFGNASGNFTP